MTCSDTTMGAETMFYQKNDFIGYSHIQHLVPKFDFFNKKIAHFIITTSRISTSKKFDYGNKFNRENMKRTKIQLPIKSNGNIYFDFMENFIDELEKSKIKQVKEYLKENGLDNSNLTDKENRALEKFKKDNIEWGEFKIGEIFDISSSKRRFDANKIVILENAKYPYVVRTSLNNGIRGYINEDIQFLNEKNTLSFGQDTATVFYQNRDYFTGDKIKILKLKNYKIDKSNGLFFTTAITKSFSSFSWGGSNFNINVISNQEIQLPIKHNGEIDFDFMETLIRAIKKIVIKNLILYLKNRE